MSRNYIDFNKIPINVEFVFGDTLWIKQSTRTARLVEYPHRWFYFGKIDPCILK